MQLFKQRNHSKRNILIVEDEQINREILGNILHENYNVIYAANGQEALKRLANPTIKFSLILLDLLMPVMDGFEFLKRHNNNERLKEIPVIVMTSEYSAEVKSINNGAADFITKPYSMPEVILARCTRIIEMFEDRNLIRHTEKDKLSGLYTRDYFFEHLRQLEAQNKNIDRDAIVVDIEHFHLINEIYGRYTGNAILAKVGKCLQEKLANTNAIACRVDADIFYIYSEHNENYKPLLNALQNSVNKIQNVNNVCIKLGLWQSVSKDTEPEAWFDRTKKACNRISGDYTQQIAIYNKELHDRHVFEEYLISEVQSAIDEHQFVVYYQPKYNIQGDKPHLKSAEALVRWIHPTFGFINPGDFIPLFESNGLVQKVDHYVWNETAEQIHKWKNELNYVLPVSVNVSRIDFYDTNLENKLTSILDTNELTTNELTLEITESAYSENSEILINQLKKLRHKGFLIEMDDFGTGYSSLNMLTELPIDILKIDLSFIRNMEKNSNNKKLVELIIDIAKFLHLPTIAEGVETKSQLDTLKNMGCDIIQGYYFSKPVPPADFAKLIKAELQQIN